MESLNEERIADAVDLLERAALAEGEGREFCNPDRRFICKFFLTHAADPTAQAMWDEYIADEDD